MGRKFTVVAKTEDTYRRRRYRRHGLNLCYETPALLFHSPEGNSLQDAARLIADTTVREVVGPIVCVEEVDSGTLLHGALTSMPTPDRATAEDAVYYHKDGALLSFKIVDRFKECIEPVRDLLGCSECPDKGFSCISGEVHGKKVVDDGPSVMESVKDALALFKDRKSRIGEYTFVSPVLLAETSETFVTSGRRASDIDWSAEEERRKQRRDNSNAAAVSRNFKKTECSVCVAAAAGCNRYRHCRGAYEPPEVFEKKILAEWLPRLESKNNVLKPWQLYGLMNLSGESGSRAWDRRQVVLGNLNYSEEAFRVRIAAVKRKADALHATTQDWARLREVFPRLPENESDKYARRPTDKALALYFAAIQRGRFGAVRRGFHGYLSDALAWAQTSLNGDSITVARERPWGIPDSTSSWSPSTIRDWSEFYEKFDVLPAEQRSTRPEVRAR